MPDSSPATPSTVGGKSLGFVVGSDGAAVHLYISSSLSAAYDILTDDGYPPEKAANVLTAAERSGRDPEALARHMVKLRKALR